MSKEKITEEELSALKEELRAQILSEEKQKSKSSEAESERKSRESMERAKQDTVEIELFQDDGKYKDDVYVAVNGIRYKIKRGVRVRVPRFVAEVLERSNIQDKSTAAMISKYESDYRQAVSQNRI